MAHHRFTDRARSLRVNQTDTEGRLWGELRNRQLGGWKWKRQVPKGSYIVDFLCVEASLVLELDGGQHLEQAAYDARRTKYLEGLGLRVLRFWCNEVFENLDGVCGTILQACGGEHPSWAAEVASGAGPSPNPLPICDGERAKTRVKLRKWTPPTR